MEEMFSRLAVFFQMPFVRYAFIVGILIALCASLLGVTLVLKRFSFIGDGLSHVAFGAMAVAAVVGLTNNMFIVMPITIISAVLLLRTGTNTRIKGDAAVAMISVGALAFGYLLMNKFPTSANVSGDVCTTLFGSTSIITLKEEDVWFCAVLSLVVVLAFIFFYNKIFSVTFDYRDNHCGHYRNRNEPCRFAPDFRAYNFPCAFRDARVQELQIRHDLLGVPVGILRGDRYSGIYPR